MNILLFLIFLFSNIYCDPELQPTLAQVQKLEGGSELIEKVLQDGSITIRTEREFPFGAYWDASKRTIGIVSEENRVYSLLFELHNAASQKDFDRMNSLARDGKISKKEYIQRVEMIEYENTHKTALLIDEGIRQGLFPKSSKIRYSSRLESHLQAQQSSGHSAWIGDIYDSLTTS